MCNRSSNLGAGRRRATVALAAVALLAWGGMVLAEPPAKADAAKRSEVGKVLGPVGSVWQREKPEADWKPLGDGAAPFSEDLTLGIPGAAIDGPKGATRLEFLTDLSGTAPLPVIEAAVVLHDNSNLDLDFTLDRGRVDVTNRKEKGAAQVRVRFADRYWDLTLAEPGTHVALLLYSRWPPGSTFSTEQTPDNVPLTSLVLLVLKGRIDRKCPACEHALREPPGPALFQWDNVNGQDARPQVIEKVPDWAETTAPMTDDAKERLARLEKFRKLAVKDGVTSALTEMLASDDRYDRRLGVYACGAFDQLPLLGNALAEGKNLDVWEHGVVALRHWIGRGPGQDLKLYNALVEKRNYKPGHAEIVLQLLHGFSEEDATQPETYETLIELLRHEQPAVRRLAAWQLYRMVPVAAKKIPIDLKATKEELGKAYKMWKELVPHGKMPPKMKPEKPEKPEKPDGK